MPLKPIHGGLLCAALTGCTLGPAAPPALPDTTLPDDDGAWKAQGKAFRAGVVTASEPLAARAGAEVLAKGGNAIDAAITVMFMNNVVEPQSSGIGGGGFMMIRLADSGETLIVNCRERAPAATTPDMFVSQPDANLRTSSGYSVGVPGALRCASTALEKWGTITLAEALQPAIAAANDGVVVSTRLANDILAAKLSHEAATGARALFRPNDIPLQAGDLLVQPELAQTFERVAEAGPDAFYQCGHQAGIAEAIVAAQLVTRRGNPDGVGRMTCADLESYEPEILSPISASYRGYEILTMPPPSSGGVALLQILGMLERFPIGDAEAGFGFGEFATLNVMLEAMRLAFADRATWIGDENCLGCPVVPVKGLLADAYLAERAALIEVGRRRLGITAGDPRPHDPEYPEYPDANRLSKLEAANSEQAGDTSHLVVIDEDGNIVTFTNTIEAKWGTGLMVPGAGFLLNDELSDFNRVPTYNPDPLAFDPGANDPAPGKIPRSSMAPTIVLLDGKPIAAYGSPGGATIINTVLSVTLNLIDHRMTLQQSVLAPRVSLATAADDGVVEREPGFAAEVLLALQAIGYQFIANPAIGAAQAIITIPESGKQYGAADPRRIGGVVAADDLKP